MVPVKVLYREHVPPDVTACIFWLKNRRPDLWRDRHDLAATVKTPEDTRPVQEQWNSLIDRMLAAGAISVVPDYLIPPPRHMKQS